MSWQWQPLTRLMATVVIVCVVRACLAPMVAFQRWTRHRSQQQQQHQESFGITIVWSPFCISFNYHCCLCVCILLAECPANTNVCSGDYRQASPATDVLCRWIGHQPVRAAGTGTIGCCPLVTGRALERVLVRLFPTDSGDGHNSCGGHRTTQILASGQTMLFVACTHTHIPLDSRHRNKHSHNRQEKPNRRLLSSWL